MNTKTTIREEWEDFSLLALPKVSPRDNYDLRMVFFSGALTALVMAEEIDALPRKERTERREAILKEAMSVCEQIANAQSGAN
jgi:hypothetical protein